MEFGMELSMLLWLNIFTILEKDLKHISIIWTGYAYKLLLSMSVLF